MRLLLYCLLAFTFVISGFLAERISAKKCTEYQFQSRKCPFNYSPLFGLDRRVARPKEFPHSALIGWEESNEHKDWLCSGILISDQFVVTLAECLEISPIFGVKPTHVRLGDFNYGSSNDDAEPIDVRIAEMFIHPNYTDEIYYNNIGLLRLDKTFQFNAHIRPACLPQKHDLDYIDSAILAGWPMKVYNPPRAFRSKQDMELRKYIMKLISAKECNQSYAEHEIVNMPMGISEKQICATIDIKKQLEHVQPFRPLEQFDGAPLQVYHSEHRCMYTVLGVSHIKPSFGLLNVPYVFTRIFPFLAWIETTVWSIE